MLDLSRKLAAVLGSMRWTLLRFEQPVIALSDHPIVVWPLKGWLRDARAINAFTVAQAYNQWIHKLGAKPLIGTGKMRASSRSLYPGYDADAVRRSSLREAAERNWREDTSGRLGRDLTVVTVNRK